MGEREGSNLPLYCATPHRIRYPAAPPTTQLDSELREELLAGSRWRAPFTATALNHCELFELPTEAFQRVLQVTVHVLVSEFAVFARVAATASC